MEQDRGITCEFVLECRTPSGDGTVVGEVDAILREEVLRGQSVNDATHFRSKGACAGEQL